MTSKGSPAAAASSLSSPECCMCGDYGIISEIFLCKLCLFRSQHRYCSNLYPKSASYSVCNWCMSQKNESKQKAHYSSNSSSRCSQHHTQLNNDIHGGFKLGRPIKEQLSPVSSPSSLGLKRVAGDVGSAEKQRRTKNEDQMSKRKGGVIKQVFKHKVRRYKLLDEVAR